MRRRDFVKWSLAGTAALPLVDCSSAPPTDEPGPEPVLSAVSVSPGTVLGGVSSTVTLTLSGPAPAGGAAVVLATNNAAVQVPGTVVVAAGSATAVFTVTTSAVSADTTVTISASYGGATRTATLAVTAQATDGSMVFLVDQIANDALTAANRHQGVDALIRLMGENGLKFYRTALPGVENGANGLIAASDVVLIKVNVQWKYRGCTNSDLVRGLIQRILDHPDGFAGEVVIFDNGQGRGSLNCDTSATYDGDTGVHANAQNESHSFRWLVESLFRDSRVSAFLLDTIRGTFLSDTDHVTNGYRRYENVSYPCFTTAGGRRVELRDGIWNGSTHEANLKLINVPVLKHHDWNGSLFTGALKHVYGIVSMADGQHDPRHYASLGETCGKMMVSVHTPVLNILDAIWVSYASLSGYPASTTFRANRMAASQDPLALDYWAAKHILFPIDGNIRHDPDFSLIDDWMTAAREVINGRGGFDQADRGIQVGLVTKTESEMRLFAAVP